MRLSIISLYLFLTACGGGVARPPRVILSPPSPPPPEMVEPATEPEQPSPPAGTPVEKTPLDRYIAEAKARIHSLPKEVGTDWPYDVRTLIEVHEVEPEGFRDGASFFMGTPCEVSILVYACTAPFRDGKFNIYAPAGTSLTHELIHVLWGLAHPVDACPAPKEFARVSRCVEHGIVEPELCGACDPF